MPLKYVRRVRAYPFVVTYRPFIAFVVWKLDLQWYAFFILAPVGTVVLLLSLLVRYFTMEVVTRPVLEKIALGLPSEFTIDAPGLPLRWRLLAAAPAINLITAVVVAGLSTQGHHATLRDLGVPGCSLWPCPSRFRWSWWSSSSRHSEARSAICAQPPSGCARATTPRGCRWWPPTRPAKLAQSFNTMVEGLGERERLREAFGAYVDPGLAERVLREGSDLAGEELEVSVLFLDIRNFTAFAERARPPAVVSMLNGFWELVVPVLRRYGGHANKFIGDGLLGVFGADRAHARTMPTEPWRRRSRSATASTSATEASSRPASGSTLGVSSPARWVAGAESSSR